MKKDIALLLIFVTLFSSTVNANVTGSGNLSHTAYGVIQRETESENDNDIDNSIVKEVQQRLNDLGYDCGIADGISGPRTIESIKQYQKDHNLTVDGNYTDELLKALFTEGEEEQISEETEVNAEDLLKRIEELEKENAELRADKEHDDETEAVLETISDETPGIENGTQRPLYRALDYVTLGQYIGLSAEVNHESDISTELMNQLYETCTINEYPEGLVTYSVDTLHNYYVQMADYYGMKIEDFLSMYFDIDEDTFEKEAVDIAKESLRQEMILSAIAEQEKLDITEEEYAAGCEKYSEDMGFASVDEFIAAYGEADIRHSLLMDEAMDFVTDHAIVSITNVEEAVILRPCIIRSKPSSFYEKLGELKAGDTVRVVEVCSEKYIGTDWCIVEKDGIQGYVPTSYLEFGGDKTEEITEAVETAETSDQAVNDIGTETEAPGLYNDGLEEYNSGDYLYITNEDLDKYGKNMVGAKIYIVSKVDDMKDNLIQTTLHSGYMMSGFDVADNFDRYCESISKGDTVAILGTVADYNDYSIMGHCVQVSDCLVIAAGEDAEQYRKASSDAALSGYFIEEVEPQLFEVQNPVIYEGNGTIVQITEVKDGGSSFDIKVNIVNNSDLNLGFNARAYAVNGIMTGNNIYDMDCDVAAHRQANTTLKLKKDFLEEYKISTVKRIDLLLWAYDNDKAYKEFDSGQLTILTTADDGVYDEMLSGETVYENQGVKIDYLGRKGNDYKFSMTNTTGTYLSFTADNLTFNGYTSSDYYFDLYDVIVHNGCQAMFIIEPEREFLNDNDITDVTSVEFTLDISPEEDYFNEWSTGMISVSE